eukprot:1573438-Pleurochrysis_carterae.AAC.1
MAPHGPGHAPRRPGHAPRRPGHAAPHLDSRSSLSFDEAKRLRALAAPRFSLPRGDAAAAAGRCAVERGLRADFEAEAGRDDPVRAAAEAALAYADAAGATAAAAVAAVAVAVAAAAVAAAFSRAGDAFFPGVG